MINYKKYLVHKNTDIISAIKTLESLTHKVLIIIDEKDKLCGTISDGDVRRWIISKDGKKSCESLMNSDCIFAKFDNVDEMLNLAKKRGVSLIPLVNQDNEVIGVHETEFLRTERKANTAVIMAGGKGTRLLPLTQSIPKPMIEVGGKPIIKRIIDKLIVEGFENIVISLGHLSEVIENYVKNSNFNANIVFSKEEKPLGTAGALANIKKLGINYPILVTNGDILCECNLSRVLDKAQDNKYDGIMLGKEEKFTMPFGVIEHDNGRWKGITEKPIYKFIINAGIYMLSESMIELINKEEYLDMTNLFEKAYKQNFKLGVEYTNQYWIDIGRYETLESANKYFEQ